MRVITQYVILIGVFYFSFLFLTPIIEANKNLDYVVIITDKGFIPEEIQIQPGDTITWINTGTRKHWPASDDHTTHSNYPQKSTHDCLGSFFDICRGLASSEKWSFIFGFEGVWGYHDHIFPEIKGTVFVTESKNNLIRFSRFKKESLTLSPKIKNAIEDVHKKIGFFEDPKNFISLSKNKQKDRIAVILNEQASEKVWALLKFIGTKDGVEIIDGHELAHVVGAAFYRKYGHGALGKCDELFGYGCYHGVVEAFIKQQGVARGVEKFCGSVYLDEIKGRCMHGMSYALLLETNFNLWESLERCELLLPQNKEYCADGIFLEYQSFISAEQIDKNNLWNTCLNVPDKQKERCAFYLPSTVRQVLGFDIEAIKDMCTSAPEKYLKNACVRNIGTLIAHIAQNEINVQKLCTFNFNEELTNICLTGARQEMLILNG